MLRNLLIISYLSYISAYYMQLNIPSSYQLSRRQLLINTALVTPTLSFTTENTQKPICVIGASGQTGTECVKQLAKDYNQVRAVSRKRISEQDLLDLNANAKSCIKHYTIDIKDSTKIDNIIYGTSTVIFLANAKKYNRYVKTDYEEYQNYEDIDVHALKNIVTACIKNKVSRFVYVSASCRSCMQDENLDVDKMCGIKCENCRSKQMGEKLIKKYYKQANVPSVDYTIVRIGFLINGIFNGDSRGIKELEINQDYTKSGMISKYDLANICINVPRYKQTASTTFEAYYRDTAQPFAIEESLNLCTNAGKSMEECFFGSAYKNSKPKNLEEVRNAPIKGSIFYTGNEKTGENWEELYSSLKKD